MMRPTALRMLGLARANSVRGAARSALASFAARPLSTTATNTAQIVEVRTAAEFESLCVAASSQPPPVGGPVIVDFYADWCGPCKQLTPKLEKLVANSRGAVRLAKIDVDALPELAQALRIASLPTVMLLHGGQVVDSFKGVLPDAQLKQFVDKASALVGGADVGPRALEDAAAALAAGDVPGATTAYAQLLSLPEHAASARAGLALCALQDSNLALAQDLVAEIHKSHSDALGKPDVRKAVAAVTLAAEAGDAEGSEGAEGASGAPTEDALRARLDDAPLDHDSRFQLAQAMLGRQAHAEAIDELLLILRRDRAWRDGAAKELLLKLFDLLGADDPLVPKARRRMNNYILN